MDSNSHSRLGRNYSHRKRTQQEVNPIVDDPRFIAALAQAPAANNSDYTPTLPTAS